VDLAAGELRGEIKLGATPSFRLGDLEVRPATRQLLRAGSGMTLEPRVMQILVALAEGKGEVVTRDELILRCWSGRIVGENAIHRAISRLRELASGFAEGAFTIETIAKVGYRLTRSQGSLEAGPSRSISRPVLAVAGTALALAAALAIGIGLQRQSASRTLSVALTESSTRVAPDLVRELASGLAAQDADIRIQSGQRSGDDLLVAVTAAAKAPVTATISQPSGDVLWSATLSGSAAGDVSARAAARVGEQLLCARSLLGTERPTAPRPWQLAFAACDRMDEIGSEQSIRPLRLLSAEAPRLPAPLAYLALAEAQQARATRAYGDAESAKRLEASAARDLSRAERLQPGGAVGLAARAAAIPPPDRATPIALIERGLATNPQSPLLLTLQSMNLQSVGRMAEAIRTARAAVSADPFSIGAENQLIAVLAHGGFPDQASAELAKAERIWPDSRSLRYAKNAFHFRYGNARLFALSGDTAEEVSGASPVWRKIAADFLRARQTNAPADIEQAVAGSRSAWRRARNGSVLYLQELGQFGRVDEAYALLDDPEALRPLRENPEILFRAHMASIRSDRRFIGVARRLGLVDYWRSSGNWPDFCSDPRLPYDCRVEARKLTGAKA
jgi:DNA-binding winged helix-turn-helix (wHTH) protein